MTRVKKSRKEGILIAKPAKKDKQEQRILDKKPKKRVGNKPGSRQAVTNKKAETAQGEKSTDPRIGSKKPIELKPVVAEKTKTQQPIKQTSVAPIKVVESAVTLSVAEQIAALESDPRLLDILDKMDEDIALSEAEVNLYNELMTEHEALSAQLPAQDEVIEEKSSSQDDDDLWNKFDRDDF